MFNKLRAALGMRTTESVQEYGLIFFDHLKCDYLLVEKNITDEQDRRNLAELIKKRENRQLQWAEIRAFDVILLKYQDFETVRGKLLGLRRRYESILNPSDLEAYKKLSQINLETATAEQLGTLRAEYENLLRDLCFRYSFMASREGLRSLLLRSGAILTIVFCLLVILVGFIIYQYKPGSGSNSDGIQKGLYTSMDTLYAFATLFMVVFAGITGAFVSMQERLQSAVYNGDPLADLSVLTHGWLGIFLSPLSGAIFAVILFLFFAGQILTGTIFPEFVVVAARKPLEITATQKTVTVMEPTPTPQNQNTNTQITAVGNSETNQTAIAKNSDKPVETNTNSVVGSNNATDNSTGQTGEDTVNNVTQWIPIHLVDFLVNTGPKAGKDFAMLLIWCFIAGFAERFVPDALNRLVSKQEKTEEKTA